MEVVMAEKLFKAADKADDLTPVQRLAKIDEDRKTLFDSIKADALQKATSAIDELNSLGFRYKLTDGDEPKASGGTRQPKDEPCSICKFKTSPLHNGLSHRGQNPKRPFTADEVAAKGWKIIE